jgi:oligopeptide/dipeptide ABC transporter ATP-binding protein
VDGVSFTLEAGESLAIVGESGSGKSATALSLVRLLPDPPGRITGGRVLLRGLDLLGLHEEAMPEFRGREIAMIFQEPAGALNPVMTIGDQVAEAVVFHRDVPDSQVRALVIEALSQAGVPSPEQRLSSYPHQLSGGLRQRVMIAIALACGPSILIADEPTTALDVTVQARILDLLAYLQHRLGLALLLITHDLGVVARVADRVGVMYAGQIVETAPTAEFFRKPVHPYSRGLLEAARLAETGRGRLKVIGGVVPDLADLPPGCRFAPRCCRRLAAAPGRAAARCESRLPPDLDLGGGHVVRCWLGGRQPL